MQFNRGVYREQRWRELCTPKDTAVGHKYRNLSPQVKLWALLNPYLPRNFNAFPNAFLHGIIFIYFRQKKKFKVWFAFYSPLRIYRSVFSDEHFTAVSCRAASGWGQQGCQLQSFPVWWQQRVSVPRYGTQLLCEEKHIINGASKQREEKQKFNTSAFCSVRLPECTWANPAISSWGFHSRFLL